jgi:hypothetical protein
MGCKSFRDFSNLSAPTFATPWGEPDYEFAKDNVIAFKNFWCWVTEAGENYKMATEQLLGGPKTGPHVAIIRKRDGNRLTIYHQNSPPGAGPTEVVILINSSECKYEDLLLWKPVKKEAPPKPAKTEHKVPPIRKK